jgi:hypothetical protein
VERAGFYHRFGEQGIVEVWLIFPQGAQVRGDLAVDTPRWINSQATTG